MARPERAHLASLACLALAVLVVGPEKVLAVVARDLTARGHVAQQRHGRGGSDRVELARWVAVWCKCRECTRVSSGTGTEIPPTVVDVRGGAQPQLRAVAAVGEHDAKVVVAGSQQHVLLAGIDVGNASLQQRDLVAFGPGPGGKNGHNGRKNSWRTRAE